MPLSPVPVEQFSGLNLVDDPGTIGWSGAVDLLNVEFPAGQVHTRTTADNSAFAASGVNLTSLIPFTASSTLLGLGTTAANFFITRTDTGATLLSTAVTGARWMSWTQYGDTSNAYAYVSYGTGATTRGLVQRVTSAMAVAATVGHPFFLATTMDNRLVQAGFFAGADSPTGANGSPYTVFFSDAGAPDTFSANNFVHLDPGDGEYITGAVTWRDLLFVFKETKAYVFYGNSTDASGNPVFNYRQITLPYPRARIALYSGTVAAGTDGVYFLTTRGIMRTDGGQPTLVSKNLTPLFTGIDLPSTFSGTAVSVAKHLSWVHNRLYFGYDDATASYTLVYDRETDTWTLWDIASTKTVGWGTSGGRADEKPTVATLATKPSTLTGTQAAVTSRYRSGFSDLGTPLRKRVREWILEGSGSPTLKTSYDFGSLETGAAVTLGVAPAVAEQRRRYAIRGRQFSFQVGGTTAWSLNNLVANVDENRRAPGTHS